MAVTGVRIERHVAHETKIGNAFLDGAHRLADEVLRIERFAPVRPFQLLIRVRKESDDWNAETGRFLRGFDRKIDGKPLHPGHRRHRLALVLAVDQEDRPDEVVRAQRALGHQTPRPIVASQPPHAQGREGGSGCWWHSSQIQVGKRGHYRHRGAAFNVRVPALNLMSMDQNEIMFRREGAIGRIRLNRPKALNALTEDMCAAMHARLRDWAVDSAIHAVVIDASPGKAFCAGGDVRAVYEAGKKRDGSVMSFFRTEYPMNAAIHRFRKPYVALIDGFAFGGGCGVSMHGSHRVASENAVFAMPETAIGLFPDVGATFFLNRLPGQIGMYLALTGSASVLQMQSIAVSPRTSSHRAITPVYSRV